jgi:hypothetical protein
MFVEREIGYLPVFSHFWLRGMLVLLACPQVMSFLPIKLTIFVYFWNNKHIYLQLQTLIELKGELKLLISMTNFRIG